MSKENEDLDVPSIVPERDELASHRKQSRGHAPVYPTETVVAGASWPLRTLLFFLVLGMAGGGWFIYQFTLEGQALQKDLRNANKRIEQLETALAVTSETSEESGMALLDRINTNLSEIDKLWAARNKNRSDIRENRDNVAALKQTDSDMEKAVSAQGKQLVETQNALAAARTSIDALNKTVAGMANLGQRLSALSNEVNQLKGSMDTELAGRVDNAEQDIEAINAYRLQVNQTLNALQDSINSLEERLGAGGQIF